jgi:mono/diheme cytochrome c family protein
MRRVITKVFLFAALYFALATAGAVNETIGQKAAGDTGPDAKRGRSLFLKNCAHCHGDDAKGDEGPDLHGLEISDARIGKKIRDGIKGEMPGFSEKFDANDIHALIAFLRTLR